MVNSPSKPLPLVSSRNLGWESIIVEEFQQPSGSSESGTCNEHTICLSLVTRYNRICQAMDNRSYTGLYIKGDLTIIPAELTNCYQADGNNHYLQVKILPNFLKQVATATIDLDLDRLELISKFRVRNPHIEQLAMMLRAELHQGSNGVGQLYIESLANALTVNLLRDYSAIEPQITIDRGGLSARQIIQATDYINDHLSQSIKTKELAAYLGISHPYTSVKRRCLRVTVGQFHFSRLFKKSTGISPHQYVMQQRIELAKQLLKKADMSIADVALDCGFNSHSHLGRYFRAMTGMTPKAYRQS